MSAQAKELLSQRWNDGFVIARTKSIPWTPWALPGSYFKLLHINRAIGMSVALVKLDPGEKTPPHHHYGDAIVYVLDGSFSYERGEIFEDDFICEPGGVTHEPTIGPKGLVTLTVFFSGLGGVDGDNRVAGFVGCDEMYQMALKNGAAGHLPPPPDGAEDGALKLNIKR
jgi:quercetin dioxygenase-like cupin family protein